MSAFCEFTRRRRPVKQKSHLGAGRGLHTHGNGGNPRHYPVPSFTIPLLAKKAGLPVHQFAKRALLLGIAATLAACSGNGGTSPLPSSHTTNPSTASSGSRFIKAAAATVDTEFEYSANPPEQPFQTGDQVTPDGFPKPSTCTAVFGLACYTPSEIRTAYNVPSTLDGTGQTIVIVDAYGSPTIQHDFDVFNHAMGLPAATINVVYPNGQPAPYTNTSLRSGWAGETSLDVEWAHAIAPQANITLVVSPTSLTSSMHAAEEYAITNHLGSVISMSFGANEGTIPGLAQNKYLQHADSLYQQAKDANITMIASAGDFGATNGGSEIHPEFPASDPLILSVGGTSLFMADNGTYQGENVWNDSVASQCPFGCHIGLLAAVTGGAPSLLFKTPSYQQNLTHATSRQVADVSYNAGVYTAVLVYHSYSGAGGYYFTGGTSAGAPQWAGIIALANQSAGHPLGFVNQAMYNVAKTSYASAFHDVTNGSNNLGSLPGISAGAGYDNPTGLGSPNVANLIPALIAASAN